MKIHAAFIVKPLDQGLTQSEINRLCSGISDNEFIPLEIDVNSSAVIGFISQRCAKRMEFDISSLQEYVWDVLSGVESLRLDGIYEISDASGIVRFSLSRS